jgi:hypothetical protein
MKSLTYKDQPDSPPSESTRQDAARPAPGESTAPRPPKTPVRDSDRTGDTPNRSDDDELIADEDADDDDQFEDDDDDGGDNDEADADGNEADADGDAAPTGETDEA